MKYKALLLDIDGTTVPGGYENLPSEKVKNAITSLKGRVKVCFITGRTIKEAKIIIDMFDMLDLCVLNNGAVLYDPKKKKIFEHYCISPQTVQSVLKVIGHLGEKVRVGTIHGEIALHDAYSPSKVTGFILTQLSQSEADYYMNALKHIQDITFHISTRNFGDYLVIIINSAQGTKQQGIEHAIKHLQVNPEEIVAVGDGENDLPMILAAGMGVAMGNATEGLKSIADYIAPTVEEDGVAHVIDTFFPE